MNTLTCANPDCTDALQTDLDHIRIEAQLRRHEVGRAKQEYYFHYECWAEVADNWGSQLTRPSEHGYVEKLHPGLYELVEDPEKE